MFKKKITIDELTDLKKQKRFVTYQEFIELEARVAALEEKIASR